MLRFNSDYMEGAHQQILDRLGAINLEKMTGYGLDEICESAKKKIRRACNKPDAEIYFLVGGTQANAVVIRSILKLYEGVIAADTGHINGHEAGAIEYGGHKVLSIPNRGGKLCAEAVDKYVRAFYEDRSYTHMVNPGMVYISHPTECGTLYTKEELKQLRAVCDKYNMPLYLDGARLGYGLAAEGTDLTLEDIAGLCDVFYIGGTKVGALFGEAVIFTHHMVEGFYTIMKQSGAMLAKGWLLGVQFDELFTDGLYMKGAENGIKTAMRLKAGLGNKGYSFLFDSPTNQQFVIVGNDKIAELDGKVTFSFWEPYDDAHHVLRFATSWATTDEDVDALLTLM